MDELTEQPRIKEEGGGTIEDPDIAECPKCGGDFVEGWDTRGPEAYCGDGVWTCRACGYRAFWHWAWTRDGQRKTPQK